jgi:hypothetical protein
MASYYQRFRRDFGRGYYRRSYRPAVRLDGRTLAGAAVAVVAVAAVAHPAAHHGHEDARPASVAAAIPARVPAGGYTPRTWSAAFIHDVGDHATRCNMAFVRDWIRAEGSKVAWHNLLDTERPGPGSRRVNETSPGHGVQSFPTWAEGLHETVLTIRNGRYTAVLAALRAGNDAQRAADAVAASPWGTELFEASC